ncbi:Holliday junction resolvase [Candidatus Woesearchaeota archaeon]|nr:Holliday junction resolvase [Candidatus Woesearchaeota archaeon]MBW2994643.1 Holliday junction resolvase [Candidatus Woesearchaeota archaeon]
MSRKSKGINAEREIIHAFWKIPGWTACRVAGSGSMRYPSPDIIAGNMSRKLAIECKSTKSKYQYFEKAEIEQLLQYAELFAAEAWIAIRFDRDKFYFMRPKDLKETGKKYVADLVLLKDKGFLFEHII